MSKRGEVETSVAKMLLTVLSLDKQNELTPKEVKVMAQAIVSRVIADMSVPEAVPEPEEVPVEIPFVPKQIVNRTSVPRKQSTLVGWSGRD